MWNAYMEWPWTRDGTVRVFTVTMAPEVAGRIVARPAGCQRAGAWRNACVVLGESNGARVMPDTTLSQKSVGRVAAEPQVIDNRLINRRDI
jgi:hypothetical protein